MDDVLREKILAALDRPTEAAADRTLTKVISRDPAAKAYAAALRADDRALRAWPARDRSAAQWEAAEATILAALDAQAKIPGGARVPAGETDHLAPPAFDDDASPMERRPAMSEPNEHDPDLENLAALTRTSLAPGAVPSVRPHPVSSLVDDADDTSSGIVDIKQLSAMARDAAASAPPPAAAKAVAPKAEAEKPKETPKADAKPAAKKDDVMVAPKAAAVPLPDVPPPARGGGPMWAIGGMVVMAAAFFVYNSTQSSPTSPAAVDSNAPTATTTPGEPSVPSTVAVTPPPPAAQPESAPVAAAVPAAPPAPPPAEVAPTPEPAVQAHAASADRAAARRDRVETTAPSRPAAPPAPTTPTPPRAAAPTPPAAPAPTVARGGTAAPTAAASAPARPAAPAAGGGGSLDDIMNRVAPNTAAPAPAAASAPAADLPERLNRSQITGVLSPLNGAVRSCAGGETGTAPVAMVIGNDGAVRSATVSGQFAGTPAGSCIEGVVRRAHFPAFRASTQNLMFPYVITPPR